MTRLRLLLAGILLAALCGLCVEAGLPDDERSNQPDGKTLATNYDSYVGEKILVFGTITEQTNTALHIRVEGDGVSVPLHVHAVEQTVESGSVVQVYGILRSDQVFSAERIVVVNAGEFTEQYKYGVSLVGVFVFLIAFFREWRMDIESSLL
ncbi:hypothetical protein [Haloarcula montana]|uniref:hypothetical protein n=1 Tax=Haloarcula montana TaxID=3111776 RepID=UPI002D789FBF|nr:hypothetical protein [Haloarcula sp. GH36]